MTEGPPSKKDIPPQILAREAIRHWEITARNFPQDLSVAQFRLIRENLPPDAPPEFVTALDKMLVVIERKHP